MNKNIQIIDAAALLTTPPPPVQWLVEGYLPLGTVGDMSGPPGEGKSTLSLDLALAVASGTEAWYGLRCASGRVAILGGERSGVDAFARDLHRTAQARTIDAGRLLMPADNVGECPPLWAWDRQLNTWMPTAWGATVTEWLAEAQPALIIIDTLMSAALGCDQLDNPQQYALGREVQRWARSLGKPTVLSISHTNQASAKDSLAWRLHYLSRAGGNGLPGALRWVTGVSQVRPDDELAQTLGLAEQAAHHRLIAIGSSKHNEMPAPAWSHEHPAIFELRPDGGLLLVRDGQTVAQCQQRVHRTLARAKQDRSSKAPRAHNHEAIEYAAQIPF